MKRLLVGVLVLAAGMAGVFAYTGVTRDREYRRLVAAGDDALAANQTFLATEAFSGAIALQGNSMLAYLKRGETYRRRGDLPSALRDLRIAARLGPMTTWPLEQLGDVNHALLDYRRAAQRYDQYVQLDDGSPAGPLQTGACAVPLRADHKCNPAASPGDEPRRPIC